MDKFFLPLKQEAQKKTNCAQKRKCFHKQIRSREISQKIMQKRIIGNDGPHIKAMISGLPLSWEDTVICIMQNPQYHEAITKFIVDKVYAAELSEQSIDQKDSVYFLVSENVPKNLIQFKKEVYFFAVLLEHQGLHSPQIFKRYLLILLEHAKAVNCIHLIFKLFIEVLKRPELNWAPIYQIIETINQIEKQCKDQKNSVKSAQVQAYLHLATHYYPLIQEKPQICNRIKFILQTGPDHFQQIKPALFLKLCITLTYYENSNQHNFMQNSQNNQPESNAFFHEAMMKGNVVKNIFRHLFFSSKEKLKHLCLDLLKNLIIEYDGMILWQHSPSNPIESFDRQIRDESHSMNLFEQFCDVFVISILELPRNQIQKIFENEIDVLELSQYILQKVNPDSQKGKQIYEHAELSLKFMMDNATKDHQSTVIKRFADTRWKFILGNEAELSLQCQNRANSYP